MDVIAADHPNLTLLGDPIRHRAFVIHGYERVDLALSA